MKKLYLTPIAKVIEVDNTEVMAGSNGNITLDPNGTGGNTGGNGTEIQTGGSGDADSYRSNLWD